jgi:hypothetical protein
MAVPGLARRVLEAGVGYRIEAVIGSLTVLSSIAGEHPVMVVVPLRQGFGLVPMTDAVFDAVNDGTPAGLPGFWKLPGGLGRLLCSWSARGPVAYVEAEYFGGAGTQSAAVWDGGGLALGPVVMGEAEPVPAAGTPVSQALARIGVVRGGHRDEFEAAGLGQKRDTGDWLG